MPSDSLAWFPAHCKGETAPMAKLARADVLAIHHMAGKKGNEITRKQADKIAAKFKITATHVRNILRGFAWEKVFYEIHGGEANNFTKGV